MRIDPECVACLIKRALYESNLIDPSKGAEAVAEATRILAEEYDPNDPDVSARIASKVHNRVYDILGTRDPYHEVKNRSNEVALSLLDHARHHIEEADDKLRMASLVSIVGNVLDFGIRGAISGPDEFAGVFDTLMQEDLSIDHTAEAYSLLGEGKKVVYLTDNCGEVIFDSLFWEVLREQGNEVTVVVKENPILTDATMKDILSLGLESKADNFLTTGTGVVGLERSLLPPETEEAMLSADLIISKGMANFEALSDEDYHPIIYLMRTKCQPVATRADAPLDANIAKLYE